MYICSIQPAIAQTFCEIPKIYVAAIFHHI